MAFLTFLKEPPSPRTEFRSPDQSEAQKKDQLIVTVLAAVVENLAGLPHPARPAADSPDTAPAKNI